MRRISVFLVCLAFALGLNLMGADAASAGGLVITGAPRALYDPFGGVAVATPVTVSVDLDGDSTGMLQIRPSDGAAYVMLGEGPPLAFILRSEAGSTAASGALEIPVGRLNASIRFDVIVPAGQYALAGLRTVTLEAQLLNAGGAPVGGASQFIAEIDVAVRAQANIAGAAGVWGSQGSLAFIDFGELENHETATAALQVRATTDVMITAWSDNHGRMVHVDRRDGQNAGFSLPYRFSLDGVSSTLAGPLVLNRPPARSLDGVSYPILITLGDIGGLYAGTYTDTLNIDVTAR